MANKHEKQRDFHKRTRLTDAALNGIKGTTESSINKLYRPEYRELVDEANKEIESNIRQQAKAAIKSRNMIAGRYESDKDKDGYILPNGISTSYSVVKTMDDLDKNKDKSHSEETGR